VFDLGSWGEFIIILIIALVVLGPKDIPKVLHTLGRWFYKLRAISAQVQSVVQDYVHEAERQDIIKKSQRDSDDKK
jgi:sec-independent protein translocase protein TatB